VIGYRAGSGDVRVSRHPARASPREVVTNAWRAFRIWRRTRPFWGGLLIIAGASEMLASEQAPLPVVHQIGIRALAGYLTPAFMLLCGLLLWFCPIGRTYHGVVAILLALDSWVTSNLGGFFIGMLIGVVGGALAFGWVTDTEYGPARPSGPPPGQTGPRGQARRPLSRARFRLPAFALELVSELKARPPLRGLWTARQRRRGPRPGEVPVQQALWEPGTGEAGQHMPDSPAGHPRRERADGRLPERLVPLLRRGGDIARLLQARKRQPPRA
jgi:hypothetical protein